MSDDLLTSFRADVPPPDNATAQRIYAHATSGRRRPATKRRLVVVLAVLAAAGIAVGLGVTLGGSGGNGHPRAIEPGPHPVPPGGGMALNPVTMDSKVSDGELASIDLTLRSVHPDTTLDVKVVRSDAAQASDADNTSTQVVFDERVTPEVAIDTTIQDATHATWSGTLVPTDWNGGCQTGLYRIEYAFGPTADSGSTDWFRCSGL